MRSLQHRLCLRLLRLRRLSGAAVLAIVHRRRLVLLRLLVLVMALVMVLVPFQALLVLLPLLLAGLVHPVPVLAVVLAPVLVPAVVLALVNLVMALFLPRADLTVDLLLVVTDLVWVAAQVDLVPFLLAPAPVYRLAVLLVLLGLALVLGLPVLALRGFLVNHVLRRGRGLR